MQTLGLGTSESRSEGRLKSLFWPSVTNDADVDYLTTQGFWICFLVAVVTTAVSILGGHYFGILDAIFFYLGGNGVRQRSRAAAWSVFVVYTLVTLSVVTVSYGAGGTGSLVRFCVCALLLANIRAISLASKWRMQGGLDESPPPLTETLADRISDRLPGIIWPKTRYLFYGFAALEICSFIYILYRLRRGLA